MSDLVTMLLTADEALFVEFLGCFPPNRYDIFYADGLAEARINYQDHPPRLIVARLDGVGWQLTSLLREAQADKVRILGVTDESDPSWAASTVDRVVPASDLDTLVGVACELVDERRRWPRAEVQLAVDLGEGQYGVASASSAGALFVPTPNPLQSGSSVELVVHYEGNEMSFLATVIRVGAGEGGEQGMVLGVPDGAARKQLDAVVRREMMSEHFRRATRQSRHLPPTISKKIASRSRELLGEAFSEAAAAANEAIARPERRIIFSLDSLKSIALPDDIDVDVTSVARSGTVEVAAELTAEVGPEAAAEVGLDVADEVVDIELDEPPPLPPEDLPDEEPPPATSTDPTVDHSSRQELAELSRRIELLEQLQHDNADRHLERGAQQDAAAAVIDSLAERMDALEASIDRLSERLGAVADLQQQVDNQRGAVSAISTQVETQSHRLTKLMQQMQQLQQMQQAQQTDQSSALEAELAEQASTIDVIKNQLVHQRSILIAYQDDLERLQNERPAPIRRGPTSRTSRPPIADLKTEEDTRLSMTGGAIGADTIDDKTK